MAKPSSSNQTPKQSLPAASVFSRLGSRKRSVTFFVAGALGLLIAGVAVIYLLTQWDSDSSTVTDTTVPATPTSMVPPTEPPQEVDLQQQLRDWLMTVSGVSQVVSLDIDVPDDEPPLIYAELEVSPGYNNPSIPTTFAAKVNEALQVTQYSDFVVIISDGSLVVEYSFDPENAAWNETVLADNSPAE